MAIKLEKWTILEVDSNQVIRKILKTKLFELNFLYYSDVDKAKEALKNSSQIAVIILNMTTEDECSVLKFVRIIREELHNQEVRIILKTNISDSILSRDIIENYEIDGYFPKGSLSRGRLEVAIIAAVRAYKQIINTSKLLKSMAGSIAHEVRNPLNAISMISTQMEQSIGRLPERAPEETSAKEELQKLASIANNSINRANQIINVTLNSLRGEEINKRNFINISANHALKNALNEYGFTNENEKSRTILNSSSDNDFIFQGDETPFIYIIFNILKNALHYFKKYPNSLITISNKNDGEVSGYNQIIIEDTGPGIAKHKLEEIFSSFTTSGKEGGTGLGLSFCRRAMKSFNGHIICQSELGKYTRFILSFPALNEEDLSHSKCDVDVKNLHKNKILIVDDQEINLQITKNIIMSNLNNVICYTASNGLEAVESFKKERHDLVFMDIQMPVMNGYEATKRIKEINKETPVIAYTSLESKESKLKANKAGIDHYINKPISHNVLLRTIDKWLMNKYNFNFDQDLVKGILTNKKIILADDQQINNMLLSRMLKNKFNMQIDEVQSGEELVKKFKEQIKKDDPYDAILTDIHMEPGMSGIEASIRIRNYEIAQSLKYKTPIIAITGDDEKTLIHKIFRSGIDDYKKKGSSDQEILTNIMTFWIHERSDRKIKKELLSTKIVNNSKSNLIQCEYYDNDYDKIPLLNHKVCKNDLIDMTNLFLKSGSSLITKIETCYKTNNIKEFKIHVHSLKGISGNMGLERLYRFSHNLHEASKEIDIITNECMRTLEKVFTDTKKALKKLSTSSKPMC